MCKHDIFAALIRYVDTLYIASRYDMFAGGERDFNRIISAPRKFTETFRRGEIYRAARHIVSKIYHARKASISRDLRRGRHPLDILSII